MIRSLKFVHWFIFVLRQTGYSDYLVDLFKSLHKLRHPPDLKQCVAFCCYSHAKHDKPLKSIVNFLMSLEHAVSVEDLEEGMFKFWISKGIGACFFKDLLVSFG